MSDSTNRILKVYESFVKNLSEQLEEEMDWAQKVAYLDILRHQVPATMKLIENIRAEKSALEAALESYAARHPECSEVKYYTLYEEHWVLEYQQAGRFREHGMGDSEAEAIEYLNQH